MERHYRSLWFIIKIFPRKISTKTIHSSLSPISCILYLCHAVLNTICNIYHWHIPLFVISSVSRKHYYPFLLIKRSVSLWLTAKIFTIPLFKTASAGLCIQWKKETRASAQRSKKPLDTLLFAKQRFPFSNKKQKICIKGAFIMNYFKNFDSSMLQDNERHVMRVITDKKQPFSAKLRSAIKFIGLCQADNLNIK